MITASFADELVKIAIAGTTLPTDLAKRLARVQRAGAAAVDRSTVNLARMRVEASPARQAARRQLAEMKRQRGLM